MIPPAVPLDEEERLRALRDLSILDSEPEERFDRLTRLAQDIFQAPIALVSLVDDTRQWFTSRQGLAATETSREVSFCGHSILGEGVFVVPDATLDPRFTNNPLVTGDPDIRFYAGVPLNSTDGRSLGTLCVIDTVAREWTPAQSRRITGTCCARRSHSAPTSSGCRSGSSAG
jgi:GAF domain-containing protein